MSNSTDRFTGPAIFLHWAIAVLVLGAVGVGLTAVSVGDADMHDPILPTLVTLHKSLGTTVLVLAIAMLAWRWAHPAPPLPEAMPLYQRRAARIVHVLLYATLFVMPVSGMIDAAAYNQPVDYFFLVTLPSPGAPSKAVGDAAFAVHLYARYLLYLLVAAHSAAALYHHYGLRDGVLRRMLPYGGSDPARSL